MDYQKLDVEQQPSAGQTFEVEIQAAGSITDKWEPYKTFVIVWLVVSCVVLLLGNIFNFVACILGIVASSLALCGCCCKQAPLKQIKSVHSLIISSFVLDIISVIYAIVSFIYVLAYVVPEMNEDLDDLHDDLYGDGNTIYSYEVSYDSSSYKAFFAITLVAHIVHTVVTYLALKKSKIVQAMI